MQRRELLAGAVGWLGSGCVAGAQQPPAGLVWQGGIGASQIRVFLEGEPGILAPEAVARWVKDGASALSAWYGRFPVRSVDVRLRWSSGRGLHGGVTYGGPRPSIRGSVGRASTSKDLYGGWVLVHELVHLACPQLPGPHHWLEEGLSTYVEPWVRVRAGQLTAEKAWRDLVDGLPKGQPRAGDQGLDRTPTWGRTYWGGALFCLLADLEIRRRTANASGLKQALEGIVEAGGTIHESWSMERTLKAGDAATATTALMELWQAHRHEAVTVDLEPVWQQLGVVPEGRSVRFVNTAPLAAYRAAITG
ncbi:MAG: basic secretory family protein [Myxococcales bacterium]|nr:basic secretory family protein [Myxococcales bacterium]